MKKEVKKYRGQRVNGRQVKVSDLIKLTPKDKIIFDKYITDVSGSAGEKRVKKVSRELLVIHDTVEVGLDCWDYDILSKFLEVLNKTEMAKYTKNDYKKNIKAFLKFQYDDWNVRFKGLRHNGLKQVNPVNKEKICKETLIKPNEFELLVRGCDKPLMRVYVHLAYKSAGRPEELIKLKWKDINLDTGEIKLDSSKTGNLRRIFVDDLCRKDLLNYKQNEYAYPEPQKEDYVFVSPNKRSVKLSTPTLYNYLKTLSRNKLQRTDITPYVFRHTRLNFMRKKLSPDAYEDFAGHSLEVGMKFYSHNDVDDLKEELFSKVFNKKEMPKGERDEMQKQIDFLEKKIEAIQNFKDDFMKDAQKRQEKILREYLESINDKSKENIEKIKEDLQI